MGSGDIAAQLMVARKEEKGLRLDWKRTGRFAAVGGLFVVSKVSGSQLFFYL